MSVECLDGVYIWIVRSTKTGSAAVLQGRNVLGQNMPKIIIIAFGVTAVWW